MSVAFERVVGAPGGRGTSTPSPNSATVQHDDHHDHRDGVIEALADCEAALFERIVELTLDRDSWRLVAQQAIHHIAALTRENEMIDRRRHIYRRHADEVQAREAA